MATLTAYYNTGEDANQSIYGTALFWAMGFTATHNGTLDSAKIRVYRSAGTTGTVYARIYTWDTGHTWGTNTHPTGSVLAEASLDASTFTTDTAGAWVTFQFDNTYSVVNGTHYFLSIEFPTGTSTYRIRWMADSTSATAEGNRATWNGASWSGANDYDFMFEVYVTEGGGTVSINLGGANGQSVSLSEALTNDGIPNISGSETVAISDTTGTAVRLAWLVIDIQQGLTASEANALSLTSFISSVETANLADVLTIHGPPNIDVADTATLSETATVIPDLAVAVSDVVTLLPETVGAELTLPASLDAAGADTITITDVATVDLPVSIAASDALGVGDIAEVRAHIPLAASDSVNVSDAATVLLPVLIIDIAQSVSVSDSASVGPELVIEVASSVGVGDALTVDGIPNVAATDAVVLTEASWQYVEVEGELPLAVSETVTVNEAGTNVSVQAMPDLSIAIAPPNYMVYAPKVVG